MSNNFENLSENLKQAVNWYTRKDAAEVGKDGDREYFLEKREEFAGNKELIEETISPEYKADILARHTNSTKSTTNRGL